MIGKKILNYTIEKLLGEGGMGNVYLATHAHIGRKVAIKALNPVLARNPELRERFKNEAATLSQLHHPNIVTLYDYVEHPNGVFLVMEYAEGKPLDEYINTVSGPIPEEKAIPLFQQILDGVAYAHNRQVIHRDIKPSNIIVTPEGKAKILDFGIAKIISDTNKKLTKTGTKLGTVLYMSPEQVQGLDTDKGSDIYSLGITLFQILTGKCPYDDQQSEYSIYKKIVEEPLPDPKSFYPGISDHLISVIYTATAKDVRNRFHSCEAFAKAIGSSEHTDKSKDVVTVSPQEPVSEKIHKAVSRPVKRKKKGILFWSIFFSLLFAFAIFSALFLIFTGNEEQYVLAHKLWLRSSKSVEADNGITIMKFGEKLSLLEEPDKEDDQGLKWAKVREKGGKEGFVAVNYLGSEEEYENLSAVFTNEKQKEIPVVYKKKLLTYFYDKEFFQKGIPSWKLAASGINGFSGFVTGDFNGDSFTDFACVIEKKSTEKCRLLSWISTGPLNAIIRLENEYDNWIYLAPVVKGSKIFTGKYKQVVEWNIWFGYHYVNKKDYYTFPNDGFILWDTYSGDKTYYVFDNGEDVFKTPLTEKQ